MEIPGQSKRRPSRLPKDAIPQSEKEELQAGWQQFPEFPQGMFRVTDYGVGIVGEQSVIVDPKELEDMVVEAGKHLELEKSQRDFLDQLSRMVIDKFPGNVQKWHDEFEQIGKDDVTTLAMVREAEASSCFHRGVVLAYLLQQLGFEAKLIMGLAVESAREDIFSETEVGNMRAGVYGVRLENGEKADAHIAVAKVGEEHFLLDAALTMEDEIAHLDSPGTPNVPVVQMFKPEDVVEKSVGFNQSIRVPLSGGKFRHYVFQRRGVEITPLTDSGDTV